MLGVGTHVFLAGYATLWGYSHIWRPLAHQGSFWQLSVPNAIYIPLAQKSA